MSNNKNRSTLTIVITVIITILVVLVILNYGTIIKTFYPPNPIIVSQKANDLSTKLFEYSVQVEAIIRNDGGNGDVVFEATVYQNDNSWTKTLKKHFESKETAEMKIVFDEVKLFQGEIQTSVKAYAFGK